jgi:hypothetical protein
MRSADVGSDHNLVMAKLTLKLRKAKNRDKRNQRLDFAKLKNPTTKREFRAAIKNRFVVLQDDTAMTRNPMRSSGHPTRHLGQGEMPGRLENRCHHQAT